jgi:hypothetical protein
VPTDLVRIPRVPILSTGTYQLSTGEFTFTAEDLQAAAAAPATDAAVQYPRIKIDGLSESFNPAAHGGEPAFGRVENLTVDGETLYGDFLVPPGLAAVIDWAYPARSIEGAPGSVMGPTATGRTHELVITAVALLGVDLPGVSTLPDLMDVLAEFGGDEEPETVTVMATIKPREVSATVTAPDGAALATEVAASAAQSAAIRAGLDQELIRRRFYDSTENDGDTVAIPEGETGWDLWIRSLRFDDDGSAFLVVESMGSGRLYRYGFSVSGTEATFTLAGEVAEQYTPVAAGVRRRAPVAVWATREQSRAVMASTGGEAGMTPEQIAALAAGYGLDPDTATEADIMDAAQAAAEARAANPPADPAEPTADPAAVPVAARSAVPEGAVLIDADELARLRAGAQTAEELAAERARVDRDTVLRAAMGEGRFAPARREHWERQWEHDPDGTRQLLTASEADGGLAPNTIPVKARGITTHDDQDHELAAAGGGTGWFQFDNGAEA